MDVILLNGGITVWKPAFFRSIGPYKIAHWVRKHGYSCQVIDHVTRMTTDQLRSAIEKFITPETSIIGLSTTFMARTEYQHSDGEIRNIPEMVYQSLHEIKLKHPRIKIVAGGYVSDRIGSKLNGLVDVTVMSYRTATEDIFLEYLKHLKLGKQEPVGSVRPTAFDGEPRMMYDRARSPMYRIEEDDFRFIDQDVILDGEALPLDVSRGCIFTCRFCQFPHTGKKKMDYLRGMERIREELIHNKEKFGTTSYYILDDTFNDTPYKISEFHSMTQTLGFGINYAAYLRADLIHRFPDTAHMLHDSGLFGAFHGIETLHPESAKLIGKGWSGTHAGEYIPRLYHDVWKHDVAQHLAFLLGFPDETVDHARKTVDWFKDNALHSMGFNALSLFGKNADYEMEHISEFDRNAEKYGFEWLADGTLDGVKTTKWRNKNWTDDAARSARDRFNRMIYPYIKTQMWMSVSFLWYGYSRRYLTDTLHKDLPWDEINGRTDANFQEYYQRLMAL